MLVIFKKRTNITLYRTPSFLRINPLTSMFPHLNLLQVQKLQCTNNLRCGMDAVLKTKLKFYLVDQSFSCWCLGVLLFHTLTPSLLLLKWFKLLSFFLLILILTCFFVIIISPDKKMPHWKLTSNKFFTFRSSYFYVLFFKKKYLFCKLSHFFCGLQGIWANKNNFTI